MAKALVPGMLALAILLGAFSPAWGQAADQQPAPSPAPTTPSPSSPGDSTQLVLTSAPKPKYPTEASRNGVQGRVWIQLLISETGDVEKAEIVSGQTDLARAAQEAMRKWKFKPYIRNGKPVKVSTKMPFDFSFQDKVIQLKILPSSPASATTPPPPTDTAATPGEGTTSGEGTAGTAGEGSVGNLPQKVRVSSGVAEGLKVRDVSPIYPFAARQAHIQGEVILQATIGKDGMIHDLKVVSGHPILADAARGAVEQWRYRPYMLYGNPVEVETTIKVIFHM